MTISEKVKAINNNIEKNKAQHNLDRKTAKISALSSGNVSKHESITGKDLLPEKDLLEKTVTIKRSEYFLLGKELKAKTGIAKKQYQELNRFFKSDEK